MLLSEIIYDNIKTITTNVGKNYAKHQTDKLSYSFLPLIIFRAKIMLNDKLISCLILFCFQMWPTSIF
jgi:hypothetical protein